MSYVEERFALPGLNVNFAEKLTTAHLSGLSTEDELRGMLEGKNRFAVYTVFLFVTPFNERSIGFETIFDLTPVNVQYTGIVNKLVLDSKKVRWVEGELWRLRSGTGEIKRFFERVCALCCTYGVCNLNIHFWDHLVEYLVRCKSLLCIDAALFEHLSVLVEE